MSAQERPTREDIALVLAGGVAKGAFEAGALEILTQSRARIRRIVSSSSGALNAAILGAAVRAGDARAGADRLSCLWDERASWFKFLDVDWRAVLGGSGLSTLDKVQALLEEQITQLANANANDVAMRFLVAALEGVDGAIDGRTATTFEAVAAFESDDYADEAARGQLIAAALASASLPGVFVPRTLALGGRTVHAVDGGVVDNTPIKLALRDTNGDGTRGADSGLSTVIVICPYPELVREPPSLGGQELASEILEMLVNERLYRDLREAEQRNDRLRQLAALPSLTDAEREVVRVQLLGGERTLEIISIRPPTRLQGTAFSGFFDGALRREYIDTGRTAAETALRAASLL